MKCIDCPAYKWDAESICLLCYPEIPPQLEKFINGDDTLSSCTLFDEYKRATGN